MVTAAQDAKIEEDRPLVSVIIPAYNAEAFLERTLRSVQSQTYKALEIIVVNDGSTDRTLNVAQEAAGGDHRVVVISTKNYGVARARNRGIEASRGPYLAFLDADDLWHPTKVALQVAALQRHRGDPSWAGVYTLHRRIDENDDVTESQSVFECRGYILARHIVFKLVGNGSALLVLRDAAVSVGGFDPSYAASGIGGCEDFDFELKIVALYRLDVVRAKLVGYRNTPGSMSSDHQKMARAMIATVTRHIERNSSLPLRVRRWAFARSYRYAFANFLADRQLWPALAALCGLAWNDPVLTAQTLLSLVRTIAKHPFARSFDQSKQGRDRKNFLRVDPLEGVDRIPRPFMASRISKMSADDLILEGHAFRPMALE